MYIRLEMSVAFIASPNLFNILVVGIGNYHPLSSLPYEPSNHRSRD